MVKWFGFSGWTALALLAGCATQTQQWTPETVAPPTAPPPGLTQSAPLPAAAAPVAFPEPAGETVPISLNSTILSAILNNRSVEVARLGPDIADTLTPEARAAFDPALLGSISALWDERSASSLTGGAGGGSTRGATGTNTSGNATIDVTVAMLKELDKLLAMLNTTSPQVNTDLQIGSVGVREHFPTGADLTVTASSGTADTNFTSPVDLNGWSVTLTQPLLRGAGLPVNLVALRQAKNRAAQSEYVFKQQVMDLVRNTDFAYWNLVLAKALLEIRQFAVQIADEQLKRNSELFAAGKIIEADVLAAKAEKATRTADLTDAQANLRTQTLTIIQLINPAVADQWRLDFRPTDPPETVQVAIDAAASEKLALQYRPDLAQARLNLTYTGMDVLRAKNGLLPRLDLVGAYGDGNTSGITSSTTGMASGSLSATDSTNYRVGLQVEQSITNRAERARHRRAKLYETQAARNLSALEQVIGREVRQAALEVDKQWQRIQATQEALRAREEQLRVVQGRYEAGKVTNLDLLIVQRDYIQTRLDDATARVRHIQALTALYAAEGTLLERRGVSMTLAKTCGAPAAPPVIEAQPTQRETVQ